MAALGVPCGAGGAAATRSATRATATPATIRPPNDRDERRVRPCPATEDGRGRWRSDGTLLVNGGDQALSHRFEVWVRVDGGVDMAA